eukprot:Cvel_33988.t2-p1 / transcript=Cvel_33988.t2 / gene=Cvel_33988 / organism=Chromera_velia_CCMP2878 / gene_product=hypothetical protein / transcript_product=hypothetical protein / location=Cvel_scaffold5693:2666-3411(+) / protein_length=248 / sequence_SO=supercontig / SO=protein_coding / is_pseudo=false
MTQTKEKKLMLFEAINRTATSQPLWCESSIKIRGGSKPPVISRYGLTLKGRDVLAALREPELAPPEEVFKWMEEMTERHTDHLSPDVYMLAGDADEGSIRLYNMIAPGMRSVRWRPGQPGVWFKDYHIRRALPTDEHLEIIRREMNTTVLDAYVESGMSMQNKRGTSFISYADESHVADGYDVAIWSSGKEAWDALRRFFELIAPDSASVGVWDPWLQRLMQQPDPRLNFAKFGRGGAISFYVHPFPF